MKNIYDIYESIFDDDDVRAEEITRHANCPEYMITQADILSEHALMEYGEQVCDNLKKRWKMTVRPVVSYNSQSVYIVPITSNKPNHIIAITTKKSVFTPSTITITYNKSHNLAELNPSDFGLRDWGVINKFRKEYIKYLEEECKLRLNVNDKLQLKTQCIVLP